MATHSGARPAGEADATLGTDGTTCCGDHVEISTSGGTDAARSTLLELVAGEARPTPPDRPWVLLNMVSSADGASAGVEGRSASLSGDGDRALFHALRSISDVILAGATTVRAENYGPARRPEDVEELRRRRGQAPVPRLAVVTASLRLDPSARLFAEDTGAGQPIVLTGTAAASEHPDRIAALRTVADVHQLGSTGVDWSAALRLLHRDYSARTLLVEGGPTVNAQLLELDLVDELCLTISPLLVGGSAQRIVASVPAIAPTDLTLDRAFEDDGFLLLRYLRRR